MSLFLTSTTVFLLLCKKVPSRLNVKIVTTSVTYSRPLNFPTFTERIKYHFSFLLPAKTLIISSPCSGEKKRVMENGFSSCTMCHGARFFLKGCVSGLGNVYDEMSVIFLRCLIAMTLNVFYKLFFSLSQNDMENVIYVN